MTPEIAYVLALLVVALVLFSLDVLSVDVVGIIVLLLLAIPGVLTPGEALASFGDSTIVVLVGLFMMTAGIVKTGGVERVGLRLAALGGSSPRRLTNFVLLATVSVSCFLSNMVTTAVFLPIMIGVARRAVVSLSKVLMPLAFASILASGVSVVATSTNLVVSSQLPKYGLQPLGFFELAPVGVVIAVLGMLYLIHVAPRLVPDRGEGAAQERYDLRSYLSEVVVTPGSALAGRTLAESRLGESLDLNVVGILRDGARMLAPRPEHRLEERDVLVIEGRAENILRVKDAAGLQIRPEAQLSGRELESRDVRMVEAMVLPRSPLAGRSLRESGLREKTGLTALAVHSGGGPSRVEEIAGTPLKTGDVLLLQGSAEDVGRVRRDDLLLLDDVSGHHPRSAKAPIAGAIFVVTMALGALELLPLPIAFIAGVLAMILTRCLTPEEAYSAVDWRLMVLVACMLAFGVAMSKTGAASYLAGEIAGVVRPLGGRGLLAGFFVLTLLLTQPMSNQAAALVVLPVAIQVAHQVGMEPRSLVMAVTFAASCSFLTPLEPSCVLVYGPGRYRFFDFMKVGGLLTAIVFVVSMLLIPVVWPRGE